MAKCRDRWLSEGTSVKRRWISALVSGPIIAEYRTATTNSCHGSCRTNRVRALSADRDTAPAAERIGETKWKSNCGAESEAAFAAGRAGRADRERTRLARAASRVRGCGTSSLAAGWLQAGWHVVVAWVGGWWHGGNIEWALQHELARHELAWLHLSRHHALA